MSTARVLVHQVGPCAERCGGGSLARSLRSAELFGLLKGGIVEQHRPQDGSLASVFTVNQRDSLVFFRVTDYQPSPRTVASVFPSDTCLACSSASSFGPDFFFGSIFFPSLSIMPSSFIWPMIRAAWT